MGKQIGQSVNSATSPPVAAIHRARASSRSNPRAPSTTFAPFACHVRSFTWPRLFRCPLANAFGARASDDDDLVFDSLHEVAFRSLLSAPHFYNCSTPAFFGFPMPDLSTLNFLQSDRHRRQSTGGKSYASFSISMLKRKTALWTNKKKQNGLKYPTGWIIGSFQ
jgi:hypothetical protein